MTACKLLTTWREKDSEAPRAKKGQLQSMKIKVKFEVWSLRLLGRYTPGYIKKNNIYSIYLHMMYQYTIWETDLLGN